MISYGDALKSVLKCSHTIGIEDVDTEGALGRYLATDLAALVDSPRFDNSAVDGFAVRASDLAELRSLAIVGTVVAGDDRTVNLGQGETVRTMTGAPMPEGADAMVMQEDVTVKGHTAHFNEPPKKGQAVRTRGEDYRAGDLLLKRGTRLSPSALALVASQGLQSVSVHVRPKMEIIVTGSELATPGEQLQQGHIYESNSVALAARASHLGLHAPRVQRVSDDLEETKSALQRAINESDIVVFSGGASVGERDFVRKACLECGVQEHFWRVNIKPGKPVFFGSLKNKLVFALPGNPVSAQVTFMLLVAPAVRAMMGASDPLPHRQRAVLETRLTRTPGRTEFVRAVTRQEGATLMVSPFEKQGSHIASGLATADCLVEVPADVECLEPGTMVDTLPIQGGLI